MRARWMTMAVVAAAASGTVLAGCGSDDSDSGNDAADAAPTAEDSSEESGDDATGTSDELALGDPCELVPDTRVAEIVGDDATGELVNVGDGLPGATCTYTIASSGTISLSITPDGEAFFGTYRDQAASEGVADLGDLGDEAFIFEGVEVDALAGGALIQLQVFTSATTADTGGVEIVQAAIDAIS